MSNIIFALDMYLQGTYTWIYNQLKFLDNISVIVFCETICPEEKYFPLNGHRLFAFPGFRIEERPGLVIRVLRTIWRGILGSTGISLMVFSWKARQNKCALIHAHFGDTGWKYIPLSKKLKIPLVVSFYGQDYDFLPSIEPRWKERYKELFRYAALFLTEGNHGKNRLIENGAPPEKVRVNHMGIDVENIPFRVRRLTKDEKLSLVEIASLKREKKGQRILIETARILKDRNMMERIHITFIGKGPLKQGLVELVQNYMLEQYITFIDYIPYNILHDELLKYHVFVHPSLTTSDGNCEGGAPVVLLDAQATGMPVISTYHCDIPEEVLDKKTGLLVQEGDNAGLADAVQMFLNDPDLFEKFGHAGRKHVEESYSARKQGTKLSEIYSEIIKNKANICQK